MKRTYIFFICTLISLSISSQKIQKDKSPKKAAIYSAVIPGAGQIYTKKYWKVPIIYGGLVTSAYFINDNNNQYKEYREAALLSYETGEDQLGYTYSELITLKDHYKRNREISYFSFVGVYILNIIDASVNAHLFHFDVSDDISLNIRPYSTF
ncbi:MAG: hypothetical protein HOB15_06255, partial [Flavobacteriales bacterium]|nr:hypothetical protein [Flavobacteriales bacterium]